MAKETVKILDVPFYKTTQQKFVEELMMAAEKKEKKFVVTANPEIMMKTRKSEEFKQILLRADYIVPDGIGIILAAKKLGNELKERVTGYDTMLGILEQSTKKNLKIFFLGATQEVCNKMELKLKETYPRLLIAGIHNGYFSENENEKIIDKILEAEPDFVFVALGAPRQERWIATHLNRFKKGVFVGVGGGFDVLSGEVNRAPEWIINLRLEWVYRFVTNPSRWKRFFAIPAFIHEVNKEKKKRTNDENKKNQINSH